MKLSTHKFSGIAGAASGAAIAVADWAENVSGKRANFVSAVDAPSGRVANRVCRSASTTLCTARPRGSVLEALPVAAEEVDKSRCGLFWRCVAEMLRMCSTRLSSCTDSPESTPASTGGDSAAVRDVNANGGGLRGSAGMLRKDAMDVVAFPGRDDILLFDDGSDDMRAPMDNILESDGV